MTFREIAVLTLNALAEKIAPEPTCDTCGNSLPDHMHLLDQPVFEYYTQNNPQALEVNLCDDCAEPYFSNLTIYFNQVNYVANKAVEARNN